MSCSLRTPADYRLLVVKSDSSLLFKRLNELNSIHRIIMTGVSQIYSILGQD
jgi:hypothetical protein